MNKELETNIKFAGFHSQWEKEMNSGLSRLFKNVRLNALEELRVFRFPTTKDEEWRFTNVRSLLNKSFKPAVKKDGNIIDSEKFLGKYLIGDFDYNLLVFENGFINNQFTKIEDLPEGAFIGSLSDAAKQIPEVVSEYFNKSEKEQDAFEVLNKAYVSDGLFVYLPKNKSLDRPVQVLQIAGGNEKLMVSPRNIIVAEENSEATIIVNYAGASKSEYFNNSVTQIFGKESSRLTYVEIQSEDEKAFQIGHTLVNLNDDAVFNHFEFTLSGKLVRNNLSAKLSGENIESHYYGFYIGKNSQHIDNHTFIDHVKPNCFSNEIYKGILNDKSKAVFGGKILVDKDSQKTNAFQSNKTILLSDEARIDTKPQLEIYADDVKCTHGATVGQLDEEALFYIVSRGISKDEARSMLINAFANDILNPIKIDALKNNLTERILTTLRG